MKKRRFSEEQIIGMLN
jgi:putative transposase